jgi:acyl-CoA hydrolase
MSRRTAAQRISAVDAAALVRSGDWVEYGDALGQPDVFDAALAERVDELQDVKIRASLTLRPRAVVESIPAATTSPGSAGTTRPMTARRATAAWPPTSPATWVRFRITTGT